MTLEMQRTKPECIRNCLPVELCLELSDGLDPEDMKFEFHRVPNNDYGFEEALQKRMRDVELLNQCPPVEQFNTKISEDTCLGILKKIRIEGCKVWISIDETHAHLGPGFYQIRIIDEPACHCCDIVDLEFKRECFVKIVDQAAAKEDCGDC